jgi:hypothetical protein
MNPYESNSLTESKRPWPKRWAFSLTLAVAFGIFVGSVAGYAVGWSVGWSDCAREKLADINDGVLFGSPDR